MLRGLGTQTAADLHDRDAVNKRLASLEHFCLRQHGPNHNLNLTTNSANTTSLLPFAATPGVDAATVTDVVKGFNGALTSRMDEVELRLARLQTEITTEVLNPPF